MKNDIFIVVAPQLGVNDQTIKIVKRHIPDGGEVKAGDFIFAVETTKAVLEIESEASGFLFYLVNEKQEVKINQPVALIGTDKENLVIEKKKYIREIEKDANDSRNSGESIKATLKAKELAHKLGVDLSLILMAGIIREQDVLDYHQKGEGGYLKNEVNVSWEKGRVPVVIYGAGKGAITVKECLDLQKVYQVVCFLDDVPKAPFFQEGLPVYHGSDLQKILKKGVSSVACAIADGNVRLRIRRECVSLGIDLINVVHPKAFISPSVKIGKGNYIKSGAVIETNSQVGDCCIIDNGVVIAHDNIIGDGCHLAPGVILGSSIRIGDLSIVGIGACVSTGITIGSGAIISVGSAITKDVSEYAVIEGVPGRIVGERRII